MVYIYFLTESIGSFTLKSERAVVSKFCLMALSMRGGGKTTKEMERVEKCMKTETSMTDTGRITKLMDPAHTSTTTAADIKETG
jgi:hypothetical protein